MRIEAGLMKRIVLAEWPEGRYRWVMLASITSRIGPPYGFAQRVPLRPVGRPRLIAEPPANAIATRRVRSLRPVRSGDAYRIGSRPEHGMVTPELAQSLEAVFARFASERGFTSDQPLEIGFFRGFSPGSRRYGEGRAADIASVGGRSVRQWKQAWDQAKSAGEKPSDGDPRADALGEEQKRNLGYALYKALQAHEGWRVHRVQNGVVQLFGPWTETEGPWKAMEIENPSSDDRRRTALQRSVFRAHQDRIHVAK